MTEYTVDANALPYPAGTDRVAVAADIQALATKTSAAITQKGVRIEEVAKDAMELRASVAGPPLIANGSFRDGLSGWGNTGAWQVGSNGITSWARATSGSDGPMTWNVTLPSYMLGRTLRLKAIAWTTSTGALFTRVTTVSGNTESSHPLTAGSEQTKTLDVTIPVTQGTTPITVHVGRASGNVYMTAISIDAL